MRGSNNDGVWSEEARLGIRMLPPWWRTPWAYLGYVLMLGALAVGLVRNRLNRIRLNNRIALEHVRAESLHELDQAKSRFFANISHEFRTPLPLILGPLEDLHDGLGGHIDPEARGQVGLAISNGRRLLRLVNQLLDVSRLEHGRLHLQARHADLVAFIKGLGQAFLALAERKRITLAIHVPAQPLWAFFDTEQMEKVLYNLLGNAFKFTPAGGRITVQVSRDDHHAIITVQDDGPGIAPDHLPRLFDRFYQADSSSTRRHPGTGIGLALVKSLVELHRGQIAVDSTLGAGTTFTVQLPLGRAHLTDDEVIPEDALETTWQDAPPLLTDEIDEIRLGRGEHTAFPASPGNEAGTRRLLLVPRAEGGSGT